MPPAPRAVKALELLGRWMRISQGHLPLGSGCSCGAAAVSVRVSDLERDVLDYLGRRHAAARDASSIAELLRGVATGVAAESSLLEDFERSLASFESIHC